MDTPPTRNPTRLHKKRGGARGKKDRPRIIRALIARDGLTCCFCGGIIRLDAAQNSKGRLSIEHVVPRSEGGTNALANLKLAHRGCNSYHGGRRTRPGPGAA